MVKTGCDVETVGWRPTCKRTSPISEIAPAFQRFHSYL